MRLERIEVEDFKSIKKLSWTLDQPLTCLVGQNESGKSNLMEIFDLLERFDFSKITPEIYTNRSSKRYLKGHNPLIHFQYSVDSEEKFKEFITWLTNAGASGEAFDQLSLPVGLTLITSDKADFQLFVQTNGKSFPTSIFFSGAELARDLVKDLLAQSTQIVKLSDEYSETFQLSLEQVRSNSAPESQLMKLIGLAGGDGTALPSDNRRIETYLKQLSRNLNNQFTRKYYSQDESVALNIRHNSGQIYLEINDNTDADYSIEERSRGFKYFISLLIEAATQSSNFNDLLFVLDEPGNNLHPNGQRDLLRYLEELSQSHRVIYSTHSPFLINRLHPGRVQIVNRDQEAGTEFKTKGFSKNWKPLRTALGLNISDSFYYSEKVLIVEGPEDVLYLSALMHYFIRHGMIAVNTDVFSFIDAGGESNLVPMVQIMIEEERPAMVLMDSDVQKTYNRLADKERQLNGRLIVKQVNNYRSHAMSIEDLLPSALLTEATTAYLKELTKEKVLSLKGKAPELILPEMEGAWYKNVIAPFVRDNYTSADKEAEEWQKEKVPVSKVGIARCFEKLLADYPSEDHLEQLAPALELVADVVTILNLGVK